MKDKILRFLKTNQDFISGQEICQALGISRTAVWKYINVLKKEGYQIESAVGKGYRLLQSPDLLSRGEVLSRIPTGLLRGETNVFASVDSTNEAAKRAAGKGAPDESLYVADHQEQGKGRRGRTWISPGGKDIFFSILLRPDLEPADASMITLVAALAGVETAIDYTGETFWIKWPNDIVIHKKKVCGILTEMALEMQDIDYVVVGIGWNLNRLDFDREIAQIAGSVAGETGRQVNRAEFLGRFLEKFMPLYHRFLTRKDLGFCMDAYNRHLINIGKEVTVIEKSGEQIYRSRGINHRGALLVEDEAGIRREILSGEVSVRGLYGYV